MLVWLKHGSRSVTHGIVARVEPLDPPSSFSGTLDPGTYTLKSSVSADFVQASTGSAFLRANFTLAPEPALLAIVLAGLLIVRR